MPDSQPTLGEVSRRLVRLEQRMDERDTEAERFRQAWSNNDIDNLRLMLTGWIAAAAVKAFWRSFTGKMVILAAVLIQVTTFAMAVLNTWTLHHSG